MVGTCRTMGGNIIIRFPFYVTGGAKFDAFVLFTSLQRKANKTFTGFFFFGVGRCTRDPIFALKGLKRKILSLITHPHVVPNP